jgi:copper oxidase (laccase) domain-containing protein
MAWLGPALGPRRYEVGDDVRDALATRLGAHRQRICRATSPGKWLLDLYSVARVELTELGVPRVYGGGYCTFEDARFYSYRRDGVTGRMAALVWIGPG